MLDLIKNSSADSQQLLGQVMPSVGAFANDAPSVSAFANDAPCIDSLQIVPVPVVMHEVKKYCRSL
jgi:hypothetical protein